MGLIIGIGKADVYFMKALLLNWLNILFLNFVAFLVHQLLSHLLDGLDPLIQLLDLLVEFQGELINLTFQNCLIIRLLHT